MNDHHLKFNSPIRWVGGKSRLRKYIIPLIPDHTCYVEPFGGAAWVLFGKKRSQVEVLNDIDGELINFFRVVRDCPDELLRAFRWELVGRQRFNALKEADPLTLSPIARAHRFYYLIMAGWGAEAGYPRFQTSIKDGGGGNRLIGGLKSLEGRIRPAHDRLQTVIIEHLDWDAVIGRYDSPGTVFYLDPPYPRNGVNYRHNLTSDEAHQRLAEVLRTAQGRWILSSYDRPDTRRLYQGAHIVPIESYSGMAAAGRTTRVKNTEVLVMNFDPHLTAERGEHRARLPENLPTMTV